MGPTACGLVAGLIDWVEGPRSDQGRPRCPTEAVIETLRFFLREGVQWRELRATGAGACGATLRRGLMRMVEEMLAEHRQLVPPWYITSCFGRQPRRYRRLPPIPSI